MTTLSLPPSSPRRNWLSSSARRPKNTSQTLPPPHEMSVFGKTYLALLREHWFILFDRLAILYHETLSNQLDADCILDEDFIGCCNEIAVQQWPPSVVNTKQDQSPSPHVAAAARGAASQPAAARGTTAISPANWTVGAYSNWRSNATCKWTLCLGANPKSECRERWLGWKNKG